MAPNLNYLTEHDQVNSGEVLSRQPFTGQILQRSFRICRNLTTHHLQLLQQCLRRQTVTAGCVVSYVLLGLYYHMRGAGGGA